MTLAISILIPIIMVIGRVMSSIYDYFKRSNMETLKKELDEQIARIRVKPFSVSAYLERMENEFLRQREQSEKEEKYIIVLWWVFDGLRLNEDGTTEWISRRKKQEMPPPPHVDYSLLQNSSVMSNANSELQNAISSLSQSLISAQLEAAQAWQKQGLVNSIRPAYQAYPFYSVQCGIAKNYNPYLDYSQVYGHGTYTI